MLDPKTDITPVSGKKGIDSYLLNTNCVLVTELEIFSGYYYFYFKNYKIHLT